MKTFLAFSTLIGALLSGCITPPPLSANDPTNPQAHEPAPRRPPSLIATSKKYLSTSEGADAQKMEHGNMGGMNMGDMQGMDHSKMQGGGGSSPQGGQEMQGMDHSKMQGMQGEPGAQMPAGKPMNPSEKETAKDVAAKGYYTCPMHPEIRADKPGKCPKCGMALVLKEGKEAGDSMQGVDHSKMQGMSPGAMSPKPQPSAPPPGGEQNMQGMDHSKMQGMQPSPQPTGSAPAVKMQGMDHSKMPGMGSASPSPSAAAQPQDAAAIAAEMKKVSEEMKKAEAELKKAQAKQKRDRAKPAPSPKGTPAQKQDSAPPQQGGMEGMPGMQHGGAAATATPPLSATQLMTTHPSYYTCPMHTEIRSDKPGECPKCGMPLVTKETVDKAEEQRKKLENPQR
jgi:ssDNA-binding Zn-finger/Zn-ribbon topoisomerase 1